METSTEAGDRVVIGTERLLIRPWESTDVAAALGIYGDPEVTRWLRPLMGRVRDERTMAAVLDRWRAADREAVAAGRPVGHWAVQRREDHRVVGGVSLQYLAPDDADLEVAWQLSRDAWGHGYAAEAGAALVRWVLHASDVLEVFALVGAHNVRAAATAVRVGMERVGETDEYGILPLQVYRLRHADLGVL
ncbi:MAG TPA: GNAT family N-acetyltransferase [Marmoricola sp.]